MTVSRNSDVTLKLSLRGKEDDVEISAFCFPKICSPLSTSLDVSRYTHLQGLDFADASVVDGSQPNIDILIGSDFYFEVLTGEVVRGDSGPVAVNSKFGWVVSGPTLEKGEMSDMSVTNLVIEKIGSQIPYPDNENDNELSCALRRFWDIESLGIQDEVDRTKESEFLPDTRFEESEGRYEIQLPWKNNCTPKLDGYMMCSRRLFQLHSRLKKDEPLLREYDQTIRQQIDSGIIEECEEIQHPEDRSHFLPHHGVIKQDRQTTKLRVVFDGSAKSSNDDLSLNDCLQKGPNLVPHLFDTVIKFRGYPIGIIADIEKAFHQIQIAPDDRRTLKFLWLDDIKKGKPEIKQYQFRRLPFGLTPSPAILASTIRYHLSKYEEREPKIVSLLRDSFYVDDFAGGAYEDSEALQIYGTSKELMSKGGFQLRKWNSNSKVVRESIKVQENTSANEMNQSKQEVDFCNNDGIMQVKADTSNGRDTVTGSTQPPSVESNEDCYVKFLGINWNVNTDEFRYDLTELMSYVNSLPDTKRSVLKLAAKVFDPMGLLTPFTINMKIFFQSLCTKGVDWEDKLEGKALTRWHSLVNDLRGLNDVRVPRCYFKRTDEQPTSYQVHGFCDASDNAFAAVVYLRTEHRTGEVEVNLMASKTRVAPIKKQTTPRLELMGANLLARLTDSILRASTSLRATPEVILWTDSFRTLCWIKNNEAWKQYVQHRVNEIRELTNKHQWRHCPGELNPADLPSRGCSVQELKKNETWWTGPRFLKFPEEQWPTDPQPTSKDKEQAFAELINIHRRLRTHWPVCPQIHMAPLILRS